MNKNKIVKIIALVVAIVLIVGIGVFANALVGNSVSKYLAKNSAEKVIEENHPDKDFYIERVFYSFKDGFYHITVNSPSSPDSKFTIMSNFVGKVCLNTYDDVVNNKRNTAERLWKEYRDVTDKVLESSAFPYKTYIAYGDIEFRDRKSIGIDDMLPDYGIVTDTLELDAYYDIMELGKKAGHIVLYVYDENVSVDRLCEVLLGVKNILNKSGIEFYAIDCVIEYPKPENDGEEHKEGRVEVQNFLCEDIYEKGLAKRVIEANRKAREYHVKQDELKQQEIEAYQKALKEEENHKNQ